MVIPGQVIFTLAIWLLHRAEWTPTLGFVAAYLVAALMQVTFLSIIVFCSSLKFFNVIEYGYLRLNSWSLLCLISGFFGLSDFDETSRMGYATFNRLVD